MTHGDGDTYALGHKRLARDEPRRAVMLAVPKVEKTRERRGDIDERARPIAWRLRAPSGLLTARVCTSGLYFPTRRGIMIKIGVQSENGRRQTEIARGGYRMRVFKSGALDPEALAVASEAFSRSWHFINRKSVV